MLDCFAIDLAHLHYLRSCDVEHALGVRRSVLHVGVSREMLPGVHDGQLCLDTVLDVVDVRNEIEVCKSSRRNT